MTLKSVIHDVPTNSVEATWVEVITPAYDVPESTAPDTEDKDGNVIPGKVTPAHTIPAVEVNVKCHSYHETQMDMLEADLGDDAADHADLIALVRSRIVPPTAAEIAEQFAALKAAKNVQINEWRAQANQTSFTHLGKTIACDALSRSDIDAVAGSISLTGAFPAGFPGAWKAMDNSYIMLPDTDAFKAMYSSMTLQGTVNFGHSQTLKADLSAATTVEQVNAVTWS